MVFNELSLQNAPDIYQARKWMSTLIETIKAATSQKISRVLRTKDDIFDMNLAENYPLRRWLNDNEVDIEARRYIKSITCKVPLWNGLSDICDELLTKEFSYRGYTAHGLGVAHMLDYLAISLLSEECWDYDSLTLIASLLTNDSEIEEYEADVNHASQARHLEKHSGWIVDHLKSDLLNGVVLWERRNELFPLIVFCDSVAEQIKNIPNIMINHVFGNLLELDNYCKEWKDGAFDPSKLRNVVPESQETLERYSDERTFLCPDGQTRIFSWHSRHLPNAWRIYFEPITETRKFIIGYVGRHLKTVKYHR